MIETARTRFCIVLLMACANLSTAAVAQNSADDPIRFDENGDFDPTIVIAKNAIIWNGHVVNWDRVVKEFREERPNGAFRATFYFTNGVSDSKQGSQPWKDKIMAVYGEFFQPIGVTFASVMPRGGRYWDSISSQQDLSPQRKTLGTVTDKDGNPLSAAQVVVIPAQEPLMRLSVSLKNCRLENRVHEQVVSSNSKGQFEFRAIDDDFFLIAMHESGIGVHRVAGNSTDKNQSIVVQTNKWATLVLSSEEPSEQQISLETHLDSSKTDLPTFSVGDIQLDQGPTTVRIPAGATVIRSTVRRGDSMFEIPTRTLNLGTSETKKVTIPRPKNADRQTADQLKQLLDHSRGKTDK